VAAADAIGHKATTKLYNLHRQAKKRKATRYMTDTTENTTRELTMKDFFREENGEIVPVDESVLIDFKDGDIVEGEVVRIDKDEVLVDIGYKSEGLIPSNELTIRKGTDPQEVVEIGQHVEALVLQKGTPTGV
jgi:small subunit ribosomal protein S1